jgi:2-dehydro-3-deoxy-D-arabinonate dehydratase
MMSDALFLIRYGNTQPQFGLQVGSTTYALPTNENWEDAMNHLSAAAFVDKLRKSAQEPLNGPDLLLRSPITQQEVWAAGVTYKRSEEAREAESSNSTIYTRVYSAERPELFFKGLGRDVVGPQENVGIRADAVWSVPEPELVIVLNSAMEVVGFTVGNDMSSRDIEGENPLYLPQAKVYEKACAIGPRVWLQPGSTTWPDLNINLTILRKGETVFEGVTDTSQIKRSLSDLIEYLGRCKQFSNGVYLFTGTGIIPPDAFTLRAEDEVHIRIDPIGELVNRVEIVGRQYGFQVNPSQPISTKSAS